MKFHLLLPLLALAFAATASAQEAKPTDAKPAEAPVTAPDPKLNDKVSYFVGTDVGKSIRDNGLEVNIETFVQGLKDTIEKKKEMKYSDKELEAAMQQFAQNMMAKQKKSAEEAGGKNAEEGAKFLADNAKKEGVTTTASGLQYEVLKKADGPKPAATDTVTVHYTGTLLSGKVFDSSVQRGQPVEFALNQVIPCWTEGVSKMREGGKAKLICPPEIAYGSRGAGSAVPPNATITFEVELLKVAQ